MYHKENDLYEGQYKDGKFEGYGRYFWPCGLFYVGLWKNGKRNG